MSWPVRSGVMQDGKIVSQKKNDSLRIKRSLSEFGRAGPENTLLSAITCEREGLLTTSATTYCALKYNLGVNFPRKHSLT